MTAAAAHTTRTPATNHTASNHHYHSDRQLDPYWPDSHSRAPVFPFRSLVAYASAIPSQHARTLRPPTSLCVLFKVDFILQVVRYRALSRLSYKLRKLAAATIFHLFTKQRRQRRQRLCYQNLPLGRTRRVVFLGSKNQLSDSRLLVE